MDRDLLWAAIALVLVFEGLAPMVAPRRWRAAFLKLAELRDGQLRFFGMVCVGLGLLLLAIVSA